MTVLDTTKLKRILVQLGDPTEVNRVPLGYQAIWQAAQEEQRAETLLELENEKNKDD